MTSKKTLHRLIALRSSVIEEMVEKGHKGALSRYRNNHSNELRRQRDKRDGIKNNTLAFVFVPAEMHIDDKIALLTYVVAHCDAKENWMRAEPTPCLSWDLTLTIDGGIL